jgi:serine O-acetyltransferase
MLNAIFFYRISRWCYLHHIPFVPKLITLLIFLIYNSKIPYTAKIGKGTKFGYGAIEVVLHARSEIGQNCMVGPNVTIGGRGRHHGVPKIGTMWIFVQEVKCLSRYK